MNPSDSEDPDGFIEYQKKLPAEITAFQTLLQQKKYPEAHYKLHLLTTEFANTAIRKKGKNCEFISIAAISRSRTLLRENSKQSLLIFRDIPSSHHVPGFG